MKVRTRAVRNRVVGAARKELKSAAGPNQVLSKTEAKKLKKDVARAAEAVRTKKGRVTVNDAVDAYASKVTRTLTAVDTRGKGELSEAEARRIGDSALRSRVLDVRAGLLGGATGGTAAAVVASVSASMGDLQAFHESGDHGVNSTVRKVPGATLASVLQQVHLDPAASWTNSETQVALLPERGAAAIAAFTAFATAEHERERDDMPDVVQGFTDAVAAGFGALTDVRLAAGGDLGGRYLIGKASDGWVAVAVQGYSD